MAEIRRCYGCEQTKPICEFHRDRRNSTGYGYRCKACRRQRHLREAVTGGPDKQRLRRLAKSLNKFSMTEADLDLMRRSQESKCAICKQDFGVECVDHDHKTGHVRGLLCKACNLGLGYFRDNKLSLANAITYLDDSLLKPLPYKQVD